MGVRFFFKTYFLHFPNIRAVSTALLKFLINISVSWGVKSVIFNNLSKTVEF